MALHGCGLSGYLVSITALCLTFLFQTQTACAQSKGTIREKIRERIEGKRAERSRAPENTFEQIQVGGLTRTYLLHVPPSHERGKSVPLVFVFHGGKSQAQLMVRYTGMSKLAGRDGFIVVYPEGIDKHWNDGRQNAPKVDDVGFVLALIDHLGKTLSIDRQRIYATGISNGGMFTQRLACELSGTIAAIASVAASMPEDLGSQCRPSKPVSVLMMHGANDPLIPYRGGALSVGSIGVGGTVWSVADTVKHWVAHNRCSAQPISTLMPNTNVQDGTQVRREAYAQCPSGVDVVLYTVEGGGHTWPGGNQYLPERIIGKTSMDIDASEIIWDYFAKRPMK